MKKASTSRKKILTVAVGDPLDLGAFLVARLSLSPPDATALVGRGAVEVDTRRETDATRRLTVGARVVVRLPDEPDAQPLPLRVALEDDWLIVVDKPAGMPSQPSRGESATALDERVRARFPDARMMHRLDRDASGLVLFAHAPKARAPLQHALEEGRIDRRYVAVVSGILQGAGTIDLRIGRDPRDERRRIAHAANATAGQAATTTWRTSAHRGDCTVISVELETGRTHQIRVHLASIGHPILGDRLYGGPPADRLHLHAERLALSHPRDGRDLVLTSPAPFPVEAAP